MKLLYEKRFPDHHDRMVRKSFDILVQTLYGAGTFADRDGQLGALWSTEMGSYD